MGTCVTGVQPLSADRYNKVVFRLSQARLSYPEKVRQVVSLQHRMAPVFKAGGRLITPWALGSEFYEGRTRLSK